MFTVKQMHRQSFPDIASHLIACTAIVHVSYKYLKSPLSESNSAEGHQDLHHHSTQCTGTYFPQQAHTICISHVNKEHTEGLQTGHINQ